MGTPMIYQDSASVSTLVTVGGGIVRTRHLRARMNLDQEAIEEKKVAVCHFPDGLTRTLEAGDFISFVDWMLSKA
jgi:hypothetical protein